ncbi:hypothetical protein V3C99_018647 [Haemonchus contortus]
MDLELYTHIPPGGYLSSIFVGRLFPHRFREQPDRVRRLLIVELMRLDHAIAFREASRSIIDELLNGNYVIEENSLPQTRLGYVPSVVLPRSRPHFPVLYQVVNKGSGHRVMLEAKDFFIPGPDRRELNLIILDQYATNIQSFTRGFDKFLLSVMDFVWIYSVDPTNTALRDPSTVLTQARVPKATALDTRFPYFFRVREFTLVTPAAAVRRILGIVMSRVVRFDTVKGLTIAFEGAPEAVSVSPRICKFRVSDAELDEIVTAISRPNISYAIRFPEFPSSKEAQRTLCALVRNFRPAHPEEGLLPLRVFKLTRSEREWTSDRTTSITTAHTLGPHSNIWLSCSTQRVRHSQLSII